MKKSKEEKIQGHSYRIGTKKPCAFTHRACYVNFCEHLLNSWNVNVLYPDAPHQWTIQDWRSLLTMLKAFGYTCLQYGMSAMLFDRPSLQGGGIYAAFAQTMRTVAETAHELGLEMECICCGNVIGPKWYYACPNVPEDRAILRKLWRHWMRELTGTDIVCIFPGDLGGCNRNGCTHETFVELALEISGIIKEENPSARVEIGTWGTPFCGWGSDRVELPGWDGCMATLGEQFPEIGLTDFHGTPERAKVAMEYFAKRLPEFPDDSIVAINLSFLFNGGDARHYAREIAKIRPIVTWDYYLSEGEGVVSPHWRVPEMFAGRRAERAAAPYIGGITYTMTPRLNQMNLYAGGQSFLDPEADPDSVAREFCSRVFGAEHAVLGELFEAFEGAGRSQWSKKVLRGKYAEIIDRLQAADTSKCDLLLFVEPETYRQDLLWFAERFHEMAGPNPDRERIQREYWEKTYAIYDAIPFASIRAKPAAKQFSEMFVNV